MLYALYDIYNACRVPIQNQRLFHLFSSAVSNALATSPHDHLDESNLVRLILIELRPFVKEALRKEIQAHTPKVSEEDIVQIVIKQLENTVISVIKSAVSSSKDDDLLRNQEKLGEFNMQIQPYSRCHIMMYLLWLMVYVNLLIFQSKSLSHN